MKRQSSLNDLLKFVQLKSNNAFYLESTTLAQNFKTTAPNKRKDYADSILRNVEQYDLLADIDELSMGRTIQHAMQSALAIPDPKVSDFYSEISDPKSTINSENYSLDVQRLSDRILVEGYAHKSLISDDSEGYRSLFLAYNLVYLTYFNSGFLDVELPAYFKILLFPPAEIETPALRNHIKSVGVADLLVIKQHILRYDTTEIAHIENIMTGETRIREHRHLDRYEETLTFEEEKITEQEKEIEASERFELNREISKTVKEDQKFGADLSISGKYGPTIEFESNVSADLSLSEERSSKYASEYAKEVVERSLERVQERVRRERITKILKETEIKNTHSFENTLGPSNPNTTATHISGIYQFVDKVYQAQVFNYGKRQMFDLMIPEPASYIWQLQESELLTQSSKIEEVKKFDVNPYDISATDIASNNHFTKLAKLYKAGGVSTPPDSELTVTFSHLQPPKEGGGTLASEGDTYMVPFEILEVDIEDGYIPKELKISLIGFTDRVRNVRFDIVVGSSRLDLDMTRTDSEGRIYKLTNRDDDQHNVYGGRILNFTFGEDIVLPSSNKLYVGIFAVETANHAISGEIICQPSDKLIEKWQLETWETINSAYQDRLLEYQNEIAKMNAEKQQEKINQDRDFGVPPSRQKQIIVTELKKHIISIFNSNLLYDSADFGSAHAMIDGSVPPHFEIEKSIEQGNYIRFFEQAFEWNQIMYSFYPYFWARRSEWEKRFLQDDPNYDYQQFMQAGAARVVLPVRRGFEEAIAHYLETNEVWNGVGEAPTVEDPLYLSIIEEIKSQDDPDEEYPKKVGAPWEIMLPTNLIYLRKEESLPSWVEDPEESWEWRTSD